MFKQSDAEENYENSTPTRAASNSDNELRVLRCDTRDYGHAHRYQSHFAPVRHSLGCRSAGNLARDLKGIPAFAKHGNAACSYRSLTDISAGAPDLVEC